MQGRAGQVPDLPTGRRHHLDLLHHVRHLPVGDASVHGDPAAHAPRDAGGELEAREAPAHAVARHLGVGDAGLDAQASPRPFLEPAEARELDDHAAQRTVQRQRVEAPAQHLVGQAMRGADGQQRGQLSAIGREGFTV